MRRWLLVLGVAVSSSFAGSCGRTVVYDPKDPPPMMSVVDAGFDAGVDAGVDAGRPCMTGPVTLSHAIPAIYFVVDRSGSMAFDLFGNTMPPLMGPTRWQILSSVLSGVLPEHDQKLAMGIIFFPSDQQCGTTAVAAVVPRLGNAQSIANTFVNRSPGGGTPIAAAMSGVRSPAMAAGAKSLILITDGEPNCNGTLDPDSCTCTQATSPCPTAETCLDDTRTIGTLRSMHTDGGVVTHVVGFATTPRASTTLDSMAVAGGAPRTGGMHKFHSAETAAELATVLDTISRAEANCTWTALSLLKPEDVLEVRLDGQVVPQGEGWTWLDQSRGDFVLRGDWCERSIGRTVTAALVCR